MKKEMVLLLLILPIRLLAQPERIEPMNWWVGMKNPALQLLVHGEKIGETTPVINYPGVTIKKINRAENSNYLFIDLLIAGNTKPGIVPILFKKGNANLYRFNYPLLKREKNAELVKGFSPADVIYLITPDRFANGDPTNDIVPAMREKKTDRKQPFARHGGDIRGIINQLGYISDMGYTAIWPTPLLENDMPGSSYHGYAITDFYKVDPRFGTLADYKELAEKARQKGLKLVFDGVVNHTGSQYWWMKDLPFHNWVNYPDSMQITNHRRTVNQDPYAAASDKERMVKGWFVKQMPDMNTENPFLATFLIQNNIWWIETLGLGGIRQDTYPYSPKKFLEQWTCSIMKEYPGFSIVGEEWTTNPLTVAYWQQGKPNNSGYNGCLKSTMDFPLQSLLVQALTEPEEWDKGVVKLYEGLSNDFVYTRPNDLLVFGDNHDMDRLFMQLNRDVDLEEMALGYLLTIRGIPQIYYGTELLLDNTGFHKNDGLIRADFPGGWKEDAVNGFTGAGLNNDQLRIRSFLQKMLNWRKNKTVIHQGKTLHFAPEKGVYVYFRYTKGETVMVVLNKNTAITPLGTERFNEMLAGKKQAVNVITGEPVAMGKELTLLPKSILVLELK